ncbi:class I SAM-dependent methyltransferase [Pseudocolwellia agarivorans]|uniref:class I SAM-dependent methyltransferase n=1 Tax=Pseudocolwellia agarivorans TaxID=1911682 RepID=UPI0009867A46|nr:class I SAM-dependent methyltransferase [Pseudocolwellia agarivorans]
MKNVLAEAHVPESAFGKWFLRSNTWTDYVLEVALEDLTHLLKDTPRTFNVIADVGCGYGRSMKKLNDRYSPERLIAMDIDQEMLDETKKEVALHNLNNVEYVRCSSSMIKLEDNSVDMVFCHQTFHHLIYQPEALKEFLRILKPGGIFMFAESTKRYIHSWIIRLLFRHPMSVQKTADEYLTLIKDSGFTVNDEQISYPFLWWSREDLAIGENLFGIKPPQEREETLINLIAMKPL